jgi:hypothetical protein
MLPWHDSDEGDDGELVIWLVSGEEGDVEQFLDALEEED